MRAEVKSRPDLLLLLSLLLVIVLHPLLDHGDVRRLVLAGLVFIPVILSTIRLSQIKDWAWPSVLLVAGILIFRIADRFWPHPVFAASRFGLLAAYFSLTAVGLSLISQTRTSSRIRTCIPPSAFTCCLALCGLGFIAPLPASIRTQS